MKLIRVMSRGTLLKVLFASLAFVIPFGMFWYTHSDSLGFADAGEFALVTKLASVAHGPGTPSYVYLGWLWSTILSLFSHSHFTNIMLFSIVSVAAACSLLYLTAFNFLKRTYPNYDDVYLHLVALFTPLAFASGFTAWYWANNVEVYPFHVFTFALMVYGAIQFNGSRKTSDLVIGAIGLALGLANHHLTTILFIPFLFLFAGRDVFTAPVVAKATPAKKKKADKKSSEITILSFIRSRQFVIFAATTFVVTTFFYGVMMIRASVDLPFKFGQPDNFDRFLFHVSGGAWADKMAAQTEGIIGMRFPYFSWLLMHQYGLFLLLIVAGVVELFRKGWSRMAYAIVGYFLVLQFYQIRLDQTGDSDAYMLLPYFALALAIPFGAAWLMQRSKQAVIILPLFVIAQMLWNFPLADKRDLNLSKSLMKSFDESAPKNSVILISDWTLVSQYYYYRIAENFRPDLVVINYDFKFTNYKIMPIMYPAFYKLIQPEYDNFIKELGAVHPEQIYNTGCDLSTPALSKAYTDLLHKTIAVCNEKQYPMLYDPHAFVYMMQNKLVSPNIFVSGCFVSQNKTPVVNSFAKLPFKWLDQPVIPHEPGAADKIVDIQAMLDFNHRYFDVLGDTADSRITQQSYEKIINLQKEMKENIPYLYRQKGI